jgi:dephospho-CoA kinase
MGKSTTAQMFRDAGIPVWDADATVHRLYDKGGAAVAPMAAAFPEVVTSGAVSRPALRDLLARDPAALSRIEQIVHPLVAADRAAFIADHPDRLIVLDIPLLYETGAEATLDAVLVVTVPEDVQRARVLARPGMTAAQLDAILARQLPDAEKRQRADFVIETLSLDSTRQAVHHLIGQLNQRLSHA